MRSPASAVCLLFALVACSPRLDWREVRPPGAGVLALFPCKPDIESREQGRARMGLAACKAAGWGFSLTWAQLDDPALVGPALRQMRESLAVRLKASPAPAQVAKISGMTPNPQALQQSLRAERLRVEVAVFAHGLRVYQAVMLGPESDPAAWETFLGAIKLEP
jgi:hypothetical protein